MLAAAHCVCNGSPACILRASCFLKNATTFVEDNIAIGCTNGTEYIQNISKK
uniref:Phlebovirus glycoprotein G2 fusion domain-containing protein n=1 Tax=Parascaris univalens TaxID=6257 RepID=A0A915ADU0_PARUN